MHKIRYIFDLNGYVVLRNVLNESEVALANEAISKRAHLFKERSNVSLRNTVQGQISYCIYKFLDSLNKVYQIQDLLYLEMEIQGEKIWEEFWNGEMIR
jgi:hypothetical protein